MAADMETEAGLHPLDCHEMLLRLAGKAPDDLVARCRGWLAEGELDSLARAVGFFVASANLSLASVDAALLAELLGEADGAPAALTQVAIDDSDSFPFYEFASEVPAGLAAAATDASRPDKAEPALIKALTAEPGAIGAWRAWRFPGDGSPWPQPKRVFVIETASSTDQVALTARLQRKLATTRESDPQVEVYRTGQDLPVYQVLARGYGELIWAAADDPGLQVAAVFDAADAETGPCFSPGHARLDTEEAARVARYLGQGEPLLVTTARMDDVVDTTRAGAVPMNFRTDGTWIWTEASAYYAAEHLLEPDPRLLARIREEGYACPAVDGVALHRALQVLQAPAGEEAWTGGDARDS